MTDDDAEPASIEDPKLMALLDQATQLAIQPRKDAKLTKLREEIKKLLDDGFNPVIFCRFIATAKGVGAALEAQFPDCAIDVITGELPAEERRERVEELGASETPTPHPGGNRLPLRRYQPAVLLRRRGPLRFELEPDTPPTTRGARQPLRPEETGRAIACCSMAPTTRSTARSSRSSCARPSRYAKPPAFPYRFPTTSAP